MHNPSQTHPPAAPASSAGLFDLPVARARSPWGAIFGTSVAHWVGFLLATALLVCGDPMRGPLIAPASAAPSAGPPSKNELAEFEEYACNRKSKFRDYRVMLGWSTEVRDHARLTLADSTRQDCWARAALTIGLFGEPADFDRLVGWLEAGPAVLSGSIPGPLNRSKDRVLKTRQNGYFLGASAIAFLGGMTSDAPTRARAIAYLGGCANKAFWESRRSRWIGYGDNGEWIFFDMANTCVAALGYVGTSEARATLLQIIDAVNGTDAKQENAIRFNASHALRVLERISAEGGLAKYLYDDGNLGLGKGLPR